MTDMDLIEDVFAKALPYLLGAAWTFAVFRMLFRATWQAKGDEADGWTTLVPGVTTWMALSLNLSLTVFLTSLYLALASTELDADIRMRTLLILCIVFNAITGLIAYATIVERVRWNDRLIERRTLLFRTRSLAWDDLARFGDEITGYVWVEGTEGPRIRFSSSQKGIRDLIAKVLHHLPADMPPADQAVARAALQRYAPALVAQDG